MRIDALPWLVFFFCLVGLGEVLAGERYTDYRFRSQSHNKTIYEEDRYRWRPLNEEERRGELSAESFQEELQNQQSIYAPSAVDYAETPPGLPRGLYRPVEERHSITPHKDGFRFRTLTPNEQLRIKRRNKAYKQVWQPIQNRNNPRLFSSDGYGHFESNTRQDYIFRPDKRLDKKLGGDWERRDTFPYDPAFTEAYQAPMFRTE